VMVCWKSRVKDRTVLCEVMTPLLCESWFLPLESFGGASRSSREARALFRNSASIHGITFISVHALPPLYQRLFRSNISPIASKTHNNPSNTTKGSEDIQAPLSSRCSSGSTLATGHELLRQLVLRNTIHPNSNNMADNVGLTTPRGSGTSGYVQKNRSLLRPRDKVAPYPKDWEHARHRPRQPDAEILEHEAKREIEVKVLQLRDKLEEEGYFISQLDPFPSLRLTTASVDEDEIDDRCEGLRRKLDQERKDGKDLGPNAKRLKSHQVHDLAKAKIEESERLRKALGISADYEEGSHWRKQEERMRDSLAKREAEDEAKTERAKESRRYKEDDSD
jgi:hypothetical protein